MNITKMSSTTTASPVPEVSLSPEEETAEKRKRDTYRRKIIFGLFCPFALQSLDFTIIASALPFIATDFSAFLLFFFPWPNVLSWLSADNPWLVPDEIKQLNWIVSAFTLTSAAFLPFWAQLADIFGRHLALQAATAVMLAGSAICTGTSTFSVLLLGRALQGVGAAGVNISIRTILADRVSLADYALNWAIFTLVSGVSISCGPVIGGYLTRVSWRWCFAINLPVGVASIFIVLFLLRHELLGPQSLPEMESDGHDGLTRHGRFLARLSTVDYGGQMLFLLGLGLLILALTWGGGTYSWNNPAVLVPLVIGSVLSVCWIIYESSMAPGSHMSHVFPNQTPMMSWELLSQRDIGLLFFINFTTGIASFAVLYFLNLYFVIVEGRSSSDAGIALLFYIPGSGVGGLMAMFSSNVWPRQTLPPLLLGSLTSAVGMTVLAWAVHVKSTNVIYGMMALVGHGVLVRMNPGSLHGLAYFPAMTAQISCLAAFALPFGGLVGLTIMSTVFINKSGAGQRDAKDGITWAFIAMIPIMWLCVLLTTYLGNVWITNDGGQEVVNGAYLWNLLGGRKLKREQTARRGGSGRLAPIGVEKGLDNPT